MPFSGKRNTIYSVATLNKDIEKIKKSCTLQVLRHKQYLLINVLKRVFPFTSEEGSFTLEAALVTSLFTMAVTAIMGILVVVDLQQNINIAMENISREMAQTLYYTESINMLTDSISGNEKNSVQDKIKAFYDSSGLSEEDKGKIEESIEKASFDMYVYGKFVSEMKFSDINQSYISGGVMGLDFTKSTYNESTGEMSIVLKYQIKIPFISDKIWRLNDCKRVYVKAWNGKDICQNINAVYITKNGSVYHTSKKCSHLDLNVSKQNYNMLETIRNKAGAKYNACRLCKPNSDSKQEVIYVTDYGTAFHFSLSCSGINRSIIQMDKELVGDRKICEDCEKRG